MHCQCFNSASVSSRIDTGGRKAHVVVVAVTVIGGGWTVKSVVVTVVNMRRVSLIVGWM